jgi:hypothetical protein
VDNPFAYSDQFKELIFVAGCFGYRGIVVSRAAQFENFSVQLLDHIVQASEIPHKFLLYKSNQIIIFSLTKTIGKFSRDG